jgi:dienelactone hydrolase
VAAGLADRGAAVAAVDLPLHGARGDAKLAGPLGRALEGESSAVPAALVEEFARQAVVDLERALDALVPLPEIDAERVGFVGFGLGARLGAAFSSLDPRVRVVALAFDAKARSAPGLDPQTCVPAIAPRPVLLLDDPAGSDAFGSAAPAPTEIARFLASHLSLRSA